MSNVLKVSEQEAIRSLYEKGWSQRRIAQELGMNRRTVSRYASQCTRQVTAGSGAKCTGEVTAGSHRAKSACEGHRSEIEGKVAQGLSAQGLSAQGLSAQRIYQDLVCERGFTSSYESVKRFVAGLKAKEPRRVWRMESPPGEEVQVDFGLGAMIEGSEGRRRRSWVLRAVLSHSRKGYSEAVMRQDTETFLRCLENAFRHFGGVPAVLNVDNLKAAVIKPDWYDPEINPKLAEFCRHYGVSVLPCRPATPRHKGKVERGVAYVRNNALKGRRFASLEAENIHLGNWESQVVRRYFPNAKIVADRFHVVRLITHHFLELAGQIAPHHQRPRGFLSAFRKRPDRLTAKEQLRLQRLFEAYPSLRPLYEKMQALRACQLLAFIEELKNSSFAPLISLAQTLETWREPLAAMWRFTRNNGITEGFHRKMKLIQRRAYSFRNFFNYRLRVIAQCG